MAEDFGIRLSVSITDLLKSIQTALDSINNGGKLRKLKLSANTTTLTASIRKAIDEINAADKLKSKSVNIAASENHLKKSLRTAIDNINASNSLTNKPIKISAKLDAKSLTQQLQTQIAGAATKASTLNVGTNTNVSTLKESVNAVTNAVNNENSAIETTNNLLKEQQKLFLKTGDVKLTRTYGTAEQTLSNTYLNGSLTSQTTTSDYSRLQQEQARAVAAINETRNALAALKSEYADANSPKAIKDTTRFNALETEFQEITRLVNEFEQSDNKNTAMFRANINSRVESLHQLIAEYQRAEYAPNQLRTKDVPTSKSIAENQLREFAAQVKASDVPIKKMQNTIDGLNSSVANIKDAGSLTQFLNQFSIAKSEFSALKAETKAATSELTQTDKIFRQIENSLKRLSTESNKGIFLKNGSNADVIDLQSHINSLKESYVSLQNSLKNDSSPENVKRVKAEVTTLNKELKAVTSTSRELKNGLSQLKINNDIVVKATVLNGQIANYMSKNSLAMKTVNPLSGVTFGKEMEQLRAAIPNAKDLNAVQQLSDQFTTLKSGIKSLGKEGATTLESLGASVLKFIKWMGMTLILTRVRMYFNKLFTTVYDLDESLVDLQKTFKGSAAELNDFYLESNKLAKQLGVTTEEIISQAAAWSRLGYSTNAAAKTMAEMSSMFAAISPDMDVSAATDGLISIMKAFDIDPDNVLDGILSKVNIIGNTAATSNGEIVEMLQRSSAAMKSARNTLEQTIALETAAVEITRDPASTGVAWKTISARLRGLDEETLQVSDDIVELTGKFADFTKTAKNPGGISLFTDASKTTYKSTYQIIKELAEIWDDLTDVQIARIEEIMGGKRQLQVVSAAISNFKAAEQAMDSMANSAGSAEAEMEVIRDSAEYALNELKETFTSLAQNSVSRNGLKDLIKAGTSILGIVNDVVEKIGLIPAILTTIIGITASKKMTKGLFGYNYATGKMTAGGVDVGKGWIGGIKTQISDSKMLKAEVKANQQALIDFENEMNKGVVTQQTYNKVMNSSDAAVRKFGEGIMNGTAAAKDYTAAVGKIGIGAKAAAIGVQLLNTAASMIISMGISSLINLAISGISKAANYYKNLNEEVKELNSEFESIKSEISQLNEQLTDTQTKISELEKLPKLSFLQAEELEELKKYNDELERQRKERENEEAANRAKARQDAYEGYQRDIKSPAGAKKFIVGSLQSTMGEEMVSQTPWDRQTQALKNYRKELEKLNDLKTMGDGSQENKDEIKETQKRIDTLMQEINEDYKIWKDRYEALYDSDVSEHRETAESYKELMDEWDKLVNKIPTSLSAVFDKYGTVKQYLISLAQNGELTADKFNELTELNATGIEDFREALKNVQDLTVDDVIESIIVEVENLDDAANKGKNSINAYTKSLEKLYETLEKIIDKQEKLAEAFNKVRLGSSMTAEEVYELSKEMPNIFKYLTPTSDGGYTLSTDGFNALSSENIDAEKDKLQKSISETKTQIALLGALEKAALDVENSYGKDQGLIDHFMQLSDATEELRESLGIESMGQISKGLETLQESLKQDELHLDVLTSAFDKGIVNFYEESKSKISDLNNELKTFDNAVKTLNEGNTLSYDEMVEIVELAPELQDFFDEMNGRYIIVADKLTEWRKKSFEARNEYIQGLIEQAKAELQSAEKAKEAAATILNIQNKFGTAEEQLMAQVDLEAAEKKIKDILDVIEKYEALMGDIADSDDSGQKLTDELQNRIDYYKTILDAVSAVKDRYTEVLDNEIDALEESKDALKDANDERQRELDLIEARNNLENAKKRKVYVYTEGEGFKQVQDKAAVKEAEEKYRDAITEVQIAEIDKAIAEKEKQKEALEESVKDLLELEQNIQDSMAINQAMKALGLSDPSQLLSLPEDVKQGIINGLTDATIQKDNEDNKENLEHIAVTVDDILADLGSKKTMADLSPDVLDNVKQAAYKNAVEGFVQATKDMTESMVNNTNNTYNNPSVVNNNNFIINDATDPQKTVDAIDGYMKGFLTQYINSVK